MKHRLEDLGAIVERLQNDLADLRQEMEFHRPDVHAPQAITWPQASRLWPQRSIV